MNIYHRILTILLFVLIGVSHMIGQEIDLENFKWKQRVVLILLPSGEGEHYKNQVNAFSNSIEDLKDRRLLIFDVQKDRYRLLNDNSSWIISDSIYKDYNSDSDEFRIILIGLDGGEKLNKTKPVEKSELYDLIDSMPMRKSELRNKRKP